MNHQNQMFNHPREICTTQGGRQGAVQSKKCSQVFRACRQRHCAAGKR